MGPPRCRSPYRQLGIGGQKGVRPRPPVRPGRHGNIGGVLAQEEAAVVAVLVEGGRVVTSRTAPSEATDGSRTPGVGTWGHGLLGVVPVLVPPDLRFQTDGEDPLRSLDAARG